MVEDKKNVILDAAIKIFSSEGYHKAKISKIAEIAGIGAGTVYLYYKSKEDILEQLFIRTWSRIEQTLIDLTSEPDRSPKECLTELLNTIVKLIAENKDFARMVLHEYSFWSSGKSENIQNYVISIQNRVKDILEKGKEIGEFRNDLDSLDFTVYMIGGMWHLLAYWAENTDFNIGCVSKQLENLVIKNITKNCQ
jgi:TetR/AcrR family transcriptional regulator, fatty acid metabolism regulator protein